MFPLKEKMAFSYKVNIDKDKCKGCQLCVFYCPVKHLSLSSQLNKRGVRFVEINKDNKCIGCGFCFFICPDICIEVMCNQENVIKDREESKASVAEKRKK